MHEYELYISNFYTIVVSIISAFLAIFIVSTAQNWQNWIRIFLSCHCHEINRVGAVGSF